MRKLFTLLIALLALTVSSWATQITWNQADVQSVGISCNGEYYYGPQSQAVNGISVTANTPNSGSNSDYSSFSYNTYSEPYFSSISVDGGGTLTFSSVGNITSIVIHTDENGYGYDTGDWIWSDAQNTLTWTGNAASVDLANAYVSNITSIVFEVSVPSSYSLNQAAVQSINVSCNGEYYYGPQSQAVNGISVTANTPNSGSNSDYSSFSYNTYSEPYFSSISVDGGGTLSFSSVNMTSIVIHTDENGYGYDTGDWTWSDAQHTLTWTGDAASVDLANAYVSHITSIDFTFATEDPTPDPKPVISTVIWEGTDLTNVDVWASNSDPNSQTIEGSINIKVTATAPESEDYSQFKTYDENNTSISVDANGTLTFEPVSGKLTSIIIESDNAGRTETLVEGSGWDWIPSGEYSGQLKWTSETAEGESSVVLACNGSTYGCYFSYVSSVKFTFAAEEAAPAEPVSQDPITWDFVNDAELANLYLSRYTNYDFNGYYSEGKTVDYVDTVKVFKGIVATISAFTSGSYASFSDNNNYSIILESGGILTFSTELGQFQSIVINTTGYGSGSGEWAWDIEEHTLTWAGTPANSVVLDNVDIDNITSIVFTFVSAASVPTADITWDATEVATISLYGGSLNTVVPGTEIDGITPSIMKTNDGYCYINNSAIKMQNNGELIFTSSVGDIQGIVLTFDNTASYSISDFPVGWTLDEGAGTLTWIGNPAEEVSLAGNISCTVTSIGFSVIEAPAPVYPTPSGPSFIWQSRQVSHVLLSIDDNGDSQTTHVIKNIITSLERTAAKADEYDFCLFANNGINIKNNGTLTFRSIVGDITGIVITCGYKYYADDLSADWRYDSENGTLIWVGTPAETVTLSGHVDVVNISSIEFFYDPAPAPRKGETFFGIYKQYYQITGAHTAKLPAQDLNHTLDIPEYVDYEDVRYYVTEIADYAFYGQAELPNVMRGVNIAKIGAHAFDGCIQITDISLYSDVLDTIGDAAFKDCKLMSNFDCFTELPPVLGSNAFSGTTYLNRIRVNSSYTVDAYKAATNWSEYADKIVTLWENPAIGEEFFWHNQMTTNWYAVSSVSPIKEAKVLPYPVGVKAIYPRTLVGRLVIPEEISYLYLEYKVTGIGENAYKDSTRFYMVMIPQSVKSIESGAFLNCTGVENVQFLWDDPRGTVTWADANVGAEFKTAASGETRICVPKGTLAYYQEWAPAWAECMVEGEIFDIDVTASEDPEHIGRYYRTFYDSETDYLMPPSVWAHAGYVSGGNFVLSPVAFDGMVLPRGTAVVLESETPTYRLVPVGNTAPLYDGPNELVGTDVDIQRTSVGDNGENVYVLGKQASVGGNLQVGMGLYRYTGTTLGAHKAYLIYDAPAGPNSAPARFVFKHEQTTTDVENVQSDKVQCTKVIRDGQLIIIKDGKEYNAQGQILK